MTIKEALIANIGIPVESGAIELALLNNGIEDSGEQYSKETHFKSLELSTLEVLFNAYMLTSVSEGDASLSFNKDGVRQRIMMLARKYGASDILDELIPTINSRPLW